MDAHVKDGQLYVQHQKFGKVSQPNITESAQVRHDFALITIKESDMMRLF